MRDYDIKRGHFKNIEGKIESITKDIFGKIKKDGGKVVTSFGALKKLEFKTKGRSKLQLDTTMDTNVDDETAMKTQKKYNVLLEKLTGFNAKQRSKRLKKKAKDGKL